MASRYSEADEGQPHPADCRGRRACELRSTGRAQARAGPAHAGQAADGKDDADRGAAFAVPPYARPRRVDELVKRSQPRPQDPFDLTPPTGGTAPSLPAGTDPGTVPDTTSNTPGE